MSLTTDKRIKVPVTQEDIDRARSGEPDPWNEPHCPIEWALLRMYPRSAGAEVGTKYFTMFFEAHDPHDHGEKTEKIDVIVNGFLQGDARAFVEDYDNEPGRGDQVYPETVELCVTKVQRKAVS